MPMANSALASEANYLLLPFPDSDGNLIFGTLPGGSSGKTRDYWALFIVARWIIDLTQILHSSIYIHTDIQCTLSRLPAVTPYTVPERETSLIMMKMEAAPCGLGFTPSHCC